MIVELYNCSKLFSTQIYILHPFIWYSKYASNKKEKAQ